VAKGDHIFYSCLRDGRPISHHGIDCGDGTVIHYDTNKVCRISKTEFAKGRTIQIKEYGKCDPDYIVVRRAEERLYERKYNVFSNNCEHFAYYCKTGKHKSEQVNRAVGASASIAVPTVGFGTQAAIKVAETAAMNSLNPISKTLVNLGLQQAPKVAGGTVVGIAGAGGVISGVATSFVVDKMLEDDEHLPQHEREAREKARQAGQVASVAGGIAGTVAAATVGGAAAIAISAAAPAILGVGIALGTYQFFKGSQK
jgi:hypothetical protein